MVAQKTGTRGKRLKILCCVDIFRPPFGQSLRTGGGGKSLYATLSRLKKDAEIYVLCFDNELSEGNYLKKGLNLQNVNYFEFPKFGQITEWFRNKKQNKILEEVIKDRKPDLIIAQRYAIPSAILQGHKNKIPTIALVISYEHFHSYKEIIPESEKRITATNDKEIKRYLRYVRDVCEYPFAKNLVQQNRDAIEKANVVVVASEFMAKVVKESYGITPEVIYPFIEFSECKADEWDPQYITYIRPTVYKGLEIFLRIAKELKNKKFLCVGKAPEIYEGKLKKLENVEYVGWTGNMKSIYAKTKILIAPALWHEPFGMIAAEAMINKIPCIVSNRGGLPEVVGDAGLTVENPSDVQDWINKISYLCENSDVYADLSERCFKRAKLFDPEKQYLKFKQLLKQLTR